MNAAEVNATDAAPANATELSTNATTETANATPAATPASPKVVQAVVEVFAARGCRFFLSWVMLDVDPS